MTTNELGWSSVQYLRVWSEESSLQLSEYVISGKKRERGKKKICCAAKLRNSILFFLTHGSTEIQIEMSTQEFPLRSAERHGLLWFPKCIPPGPQRKM